MRDIAGYGGLYRITECGKVFSTRANRFLKPSLNKKNGYYQVKFSVGGLTQMHYVHRLVCEAFNPNPHNLPVINHIDEDKTNNAAGNLEWCTHSHNVKHSAHRCSKPVYIYVKDGDKWKKVLKAKSSKSKGKPN